MAAAVLCTAQISPPFFNFVCGIYRIIRWAKRGRDCIKPLTGLDNTVLRPGVKERKYGLNLKPDGARFHIRLYIKPYMKCYITILKPNYCTDFWSLHIHSAEVSDSATQKL